MPKHPTTCEQPLTPIDVLSLARLIEGCEQTRGVKWSPDEGETILTGLLRRIGTYDGERFIETDDVREMYVHITTTSGFEQWLSVPDVMTMLGRGEFSIQRG